MTGINFKKGENEDYVVSTDGFRLSLLTHKQEDQFPEDIIIPARVLSEVSRIAESAENIEIEISESENDFIFST